LLPFHNMDVPLRDPTADSALDKYDKLIESGGARDLIAPMGISSESPTGKINIDTEIRRFQHQLGGIAVSSQAKNNIKTIQFKRNQLDWPKKGQRR